MSTKCDVRGENEADIRIRNRKINISFNTLILLFQSYHAAPNQDMGHVVRRRRSSVPM